MGEFVENLYTKQRQNTGQKVIQNAIITHLICPTGPYEACRFKDTDHQVTHTP